MIGGILLFSEALTEDEELLYESSDNLPVAYASNDVNSTANLARGSLNLTESMALSNGYKFVWEFTPNQGNGTDRGGGADQRPGRAERFWEPCGGRQRIPAVKGSGYRGDPGRQKDGAV